MSSKSKKETNYKELFGNMKYAELRAWSKDHDEEWNTDIPAWSDSYLEALEKTAKVEFPTMSLLELIPIWETMEEGEYETTGKLCMEYMQRSEPFAYLRDQFQESQEELKKITISLSVLLKETEKEQIPFENRANITPAQLSRLKGGL